jgi:hypothetical protein
MAGWHHNPAYSDDDDCGPFDWAEPLQLVPRLKPIITTIIRAAAVALHRIKRGEGSGISGLFT